MTEYVWYFGKRISIEKLEEYKRRGVYDSYGLGMTPERDRDDQFDQCIHPPCRKEKKNPWKLW